MARIVAFSTPKHKPTRHAPRPAAPFGQGLIRSLPAYREPCTADDAAWAAQAINGGPEPDWDAIAAERDFEARYEAGLTAGDRCSLCGLIGEVEEDGLCNGCSNAAESASQASTYAGAGLGWIDP